MTWGITILATTLIILTVFGHTAWQMWHDTKPRDPFDH